MAEDDYHDRQCTCAFCTKDRTLRAIEEENKRLERQQDYLRQCKAMGNQGSPFTYFDAHGNQLSQISDAVKEAYHKGSWGLKVPEKEKPVVHKVIVTRKFTKPQPDGSLLPVEQVVYSGEIVAPDNANQAAAFIAGATCKTELTAEELSTITVKVIGQ